MYVKAEPITDSGQLKSLPVLMTVRATAEVGGWSEKYVRDCLKRGQIRGSKVGGSWRVHRDAFLAQMGLGAANE